MVYTRHIHICRMKQISDDVEQQRTVDQGVIETSGQLDQLIDREISQEKKKRWGLKEYDMYQEKVLRIVAWFERLNNLLREREHIHQGGMDKLFGTSPEISAPLPPYDASRFHSGCTVKIRVNPEFLKEPQNPISTGYGANKGSL